MKNPELFVIVVFALLAIARPIHLFGRRKRLHGKRTVKPWLQPLQISSFYITICLSVIEHCYRERPLVWPLIVAVLSIIVLTQLLRTWANIELGVYWSPHVEIRNHQPLIKTGPFAWVRHPSYMNGILEGLCIPILSSSWITFFCFAAPAVIIIFSLRISAEEKAMSNSKEISNGKVLGEEYRQYCKEVPRFIPVSFVAKWLREQIAKVIFWLSAPHTVPDEKSLKSQSPVTGKFFH